MSPTGILLVAIAAAMHVLWNTLVKTCTDKPSFALLTSIFGVLVTSPVYIAVRWYGIAPMGINLWGYAALSGLFEACYTILLFQAYGEGDLSVVYPLSRGVAPVFTMLLGGVLLGDTISVAHFAAVLLIIMGVGAVCISTLRQSKAGMKGAGILLAISTGLMIAGYHLVDRGAMMHPEAPHPLEYLFAMHLFLAFFVTAWVIFISGRRRQIIDEWYSNHRGIIIVGVCIPMAYFLIIIALMHGNVTHVAAARNVGILFSTVVGWLFLKEHISWLRAVGSIIIAFGVAGLSMIGHFVR
ncbi:MAG: EamA family transporter [Deltaproteobacteria bacterium]|nr:EamA family transporter [Deltaproteobacteria bacterium]